jgi:hypothetical protein
MPLHDGPRPRRTRILAALLVAGTVTVAAGVAVWARGAEAPPAPRAFIPVQTAEITRGDLSTSRTLQGTLGYGPPRVIKGGREGVLTSLPRPGRTMKRGAVMYKVNDDPVPLFYGNPPLYRTLGRPGLVGRDVAMVRANLKALGYATGDQPSPGSVVRLPPEKPTGTPEDNAEPEKPAGTPEKTLEPGKTAAPGKEPDEPAKKPGRRVTLRSGEAVLTARLVTAITRWQRDAGLLDDGVLEVGDLVVLAGAVRVDAVSAVVGDDAAGPLMSVTRTTKVITAEIDAADAASLKDGTAVTLRMPDGAEAPGTVTAVATVAATPDGQPPGGPQQVAVTIAPGKGVGLDGGSVEITVKGETREDVLTVPVSALLALREGGYALQLPDDRLLPVDTGLFAMGMVEVTGAGLAEGLAVVTTS